MTLEEIEAWLAGLGTTLWGTWNIHDPAQRRAAAQWFAEQVNSCKSSSSEWHFTHSVAWGGEAHA